MKFEIAPKSTEIKENLDNAKLFCLFLEIDGKRDWRLPTKEELDDIYKSENDFEKSWYWSSTKDNGDYTRSHEFINGTLYYRCYVRAVRDIK